MKMLRSALLLLLLAACSLAKAQGTDEQLAAQYFQQGDFDRASLYYDKLYKQQPSTFNYEQLFQCWMSLKNYENAEKLARDQQRRQNDPRGSVDMGVVLKAKGEDEKAEQQFDKALKALKEDQNSIRSLANAFQKYNEYDRALKVYDRGKKASKNEGYSFDYEIAQLYAAKGDLQGMTTSFMDLLTVNPSYLQAVQNGLARYIDFTKIDARTDMLRTELLRRSQKDPDNTIFQEMLIWQYLQQKDLTGAFVQSKAMDKRFNEGGQRLMELADIAVTNKEWTTAAKCYQYVLDQGKANANFIRARLGLVHALDARVTEQAEPPKPELDELVLQYNTAITDLGKSPQTTDLLRGLAHVKAYYLGDRPGAIALLEEGVNTNGVDPKTQAQFKLDLGDVYMLDANIWDASLLYSQVDLDFKNDILGHEARLRNAKVSFYSGDFLWSKAQLDVLKASTSKLIANDAMELSLLITDNLGEDSLRTPLTQFSRAKLLTFQHRYDEALLTMDSLNIDFPLNSLGDDILYERYHIAYARHQYDTAATYLQKVLELFPTDILVDNALLDLGKLYEDKLNDKEKAKGYFEKLLFEQSRSIFVPEARDRFRHLRGDHDNLDTPEQKFLNGPQ
ncbi:MAG: tetratricopeptide repeat protein [Flavobacteriales bacterium]|nr:tetratricopeptide repeat protein [Flavobacteriales bacterium]